MMTASATQVNSVQKTDSVSSLMESSNQNALMTANAASESFALTTNVYQNLNFATLSLVATLAQPTHIVISMSSVANSESVKCSEWE